MRLRLIHEKYKNKQIKHLMLYLFINKTFRPKTGVSRFFLLLLEDRWGKWWVTVCVCMASCIVITPTEPQSKYNTTLLYSQRIKFDTKKKLSFSVRLLVNRGWIYKKNNSVYLSGGEAPRRMCQLGLVKSFEIKKCHILLHLPHFFS